MYQYVEKMQAVDDRQQPIAYRNSPYRLYPVTTYLPYISSIFFRSPSVFISAGFLSFRHRLILGKRSATPDLCRLLAAIPSKAISKTNSVFTVRTGPNFSNEFLFTKLSTCANSWSVNPE